MIGKADVLHFLGESAHALEFAVGGSEPVLFLGHGFGGGNHLLLDNAVKRIEDARNSGRLLRLLGRWRSLGADAWRRGGCAKQGETDNEFLHRILLDFSLYTEAGRKILRCCSGKSHSSFADGLAHAASAAQLFVGGLGDIREVEAAIGKRFCALYPSLAAH